MQLKSKNGPNSIYVMANSVFPRIRKRLIKISKSLDELRVVRFWVQENEEITIECPPNKREAVDFN
jgi:hypothetical protein